MPMFDTYVMVDWSASNKVSRKPEPDSIWWAVRSLVEGTDELESRLVEIRGAAPEKSVDDTGRQVHEATRREAIDHIAEFLRQEITDGRRVLVGFDFAFGYPAGFAEKLTNDASAFSVWDWLYRHVLRKDSGRMTETDRFAVAAQINERIKFACSVDYGPFWGAERRPHLLGVDAYAYTARRPPDEGRRNRPYGQKWKFRFHRKRLTDEAAKGAHSVWKLFTSGSVGSQTLLGVSWLHHLCDDLRRIGDESSCVVWPISTFTPSTDRRPQVVIAEIFPTLLGNSVDQYRMGQIKDAAQVRLCALAFSLLDRDGNLAELFRIRPSDEEIVKEEGWILGAGHQSQLQRALREYFGTE